MITLKKSTYGGIDWHDSKEMTNFILTENGSYDHLSEDGARKAIINDIIAKYPEEAEKILKAFETSKSITFPIKTGRYDANGKYIGDNYGEVIVEDGKTYYEDSVKINPEKLEVYTEYLFGQVGYWTDYYIKEVENPVYAVIENFLAVTKGVPSIERMYHRPFSSLEEAKTYKEQLKLHDKWNTEIYIAVFDLDNINQDWYNIQLKVIEILEKKPELLYADSFSPWAKTHYENIKEEIV